MLGRQVGKMVTYDRKVHIVFLSVGKAIILAGLLCTIRPDVSASPRGNELLLQCNASIRQAEGERLTEEEKLWSILCLSYLEGFLDSHAVEEAGRQKPLYCLPKQDFTVGQLARIVVETLKNTPHKLHEEARVLIATSLITLFPCK